MDGSSPSKFLTVESCGAATITLEEKHLNDNNSIARQMWWIREGRIYSMCDRVEPNQGIEQVISVGSGNDFPRIAELHSRNQGSADSSEPISIFQFNGPVEGGVIRASIGYLYAGLQIYLKEASYNHAVPVFCKFKVSTDFDLELKLKDCKFLGV